MSTPLTPQSVRLDSFSIRGYSPAKQPAFASETFLKRKQNMNVIKENLLFEKGSARKPPPMLDSPDEPDERRIFSEVYPYCLTEEDDEENKTVKAESGASQDSVTHVI